MLQGRSVENDEVEKLKLYASQRGDLSVEDRCLLWGTRVIVPPQLRSAVLDELHEGHLGICCMKCFARNYVWWPGFDAELER